MPKEYKCAYCPDQAEGVSIYDDGKGNPICEDCLCDGKHETGPQ